MASKKHWLPLFITNFFGIFNNNFFKNLICFYSITWVAGTEMSASFIVTLASGLYVISYIFFSPIAGMLAKKYVKVKTLKVLRLIEIPLILLSIFSFYIQNIYLALTLLFLLGLVSTLFSPSKYGLIRDIGGNEGISYGTGSLEMLTFLGVLIGTLAASLVSDNFKLLFMALIMIGAASVALVSVFMIKANESDTDTSSENTLNPIKFLIISIKDAAKFKGINSVIVGLGAFWMVGNLIQMTLIVHCPEFLHMTNTQTGIVMTFAALGIGLGSYVTGIISFKKVEVGFSPIGALGIIISLGMVLILKPDGWLFSTLIFTTAFFCGMYMVPLSAYIQHAVEGRKQGDMIAYSNFTSFLFIFISTGLYGLITSFLNTYYVFLLIIILVIVSTLIMLKSVPDMKLRSLKKMGIKK